MIPCNTDTEVSIFNTARYGTTADLLGLVPELFKRFSP